MFIVFKMMDVMTLIKTFSFVQIVLFGIFCIYLPNCTIIDSEMLTIDKNINKILAIDLWFGLYSPLFGEAIIFINL